MHIGQIILAELRRQRRTAAWLANEICVTRTHIYKIFDKESIDTALLWRISRALRCDFFSEFSDGLKEHSQNNVSDLNT